MRPDRRKLLRWGVALGGLVALGTTARYLLLPPSPSASLGQGAELPAAQRALAAELVAGILENYSEADAAHAHECLAANGGVDALHFADDDVDFEGGLRAGPVRTEDLYCAESWQDRLCVVEVIGADLAEEEIAELRAREMTPQRSATYRIATTAYVADELAAQRLGRPASRSTKGLLRDALIERGRANGFSVPG